MVTSTSYGVKVSVETFFQDDFSNSNVHVFAYRITIENKSEHTVQLLRRHWHIYEATGLWREVEGEGVVGEQPELGPGHLHQYVSGCNLGSPIGKMYGTYLMERKSDGVLFEVIIPEFYMVAPCMLN